MIPIITSIVYFIFAFGVTSLVQTQVITMDRYLCVIAFLVFSTVLIGYFFKHTLTDYFRTVDLRKGGMLLGGSLVIHVVVSYVVINFLPQPDWPFSSRGTSFLLMNDYFVWAKPVDILVQQLLVLLLVLRLHALSISLKNIITFFVLGFGAVHIFQIFKTDLVIGLSFTVGAVMLSFVFPYFILKKKNGFIYNYMLHLLVYDIAAVLSHVLY